jgi:two-component system, cell cycle sensor histidine kinase and response regulator CckA
MSLHETKILIVEDERLVAKDIQECLKRLGYFDCKITASGDSALNLLQEETYNLILMDIMIKGTMDGIETAEQINIKYKIPLIFLTAYTDEETISRAKKAEPFGYILKPFEERDLYITIEMALNKHRMGLKLQERKKWFESTLNCLAEAVITTNAKGFIQYMNPLAENLTEWKKDEAQNKYFTDVFVIENSSYQNSALTIDYFIDNREILPQTFLISKTGRKILIEDNATPIKENNVVLGMVLVFRDITEKKYLEEELLKSKKLESLGVLAGGIAHDFNNILTGILGSLSLSKLLSNSNEKLNKLLEKAEIAVGKAKDLTQQLLVFSKGGSPVKETATILDLIKDSAEFVLHGSNIKLDIEADNDLKNVSIDKNQISYVIQNVIKNSKEALPNGGIIYIECQNVILKESNSYNLKEGSYIEVKIKDEGLGIPSENIGKVFDPYYSTKKKGSGLGLATAYSVIRKHSGYIDINSKEMIGTEIRFFLPTIEDKILKKIMQNDQTIAKGTGAVLLMDDDLMICEVTGNILNMLGYKTFIANHGERALEIYKENFESGKKIDLVILDLTIQGGMGGKETMENLLSYDPNVKAIVSSGYSDDPIMSNFERYGFKGFIAKPYQINDLSQKLKEVIEGN